MATTNQTKHFENNDGDSSLETVEIIHCIFNAFLIPISITGNALVLVAILRSPSLRSPSIILLCCLAVSDLFVGILVQPSFIVYHLTKSSNFYKAMKATSFVACGVSLWTMGAIAVDRCIALPLSPQIRAVGDNSSCNLPFDNSLDCCFYLSILNAIGKPCLCCDCGC